MESRNKEIVGDKYADTVPETYSAEVLAEMYKTSRPDFLGLNIEEATNHWNLNTIYEFLYHVRNLSDIDQTIKWFAEMWAESHRLYESYTNIKDPELTENYWRFVHSLNDIKESLIRRFEAEERRDTLRVQMLLGYNTTTATAETLIENPKKSDKTDSPHFEEGTEKPFNSGRLLDY